jgi:signal transduction histidine kinase/ligand-binding sensor domain-containing protein/DNA-binding response OmpR family regulator
MTRLLLFFSVFLISGNNLSAISRLQLRNIGFKEGLNNMNISAIEQDQLGYIWVATMGGVSRYNGYEFKRFNFDSDNPASLRSNHVYSLFCSSEGLLYIGTANGIDCYDSRTDKLTAISIDFKNTVTAFSEHSGLIYIGTNIGLYRFNPANNKLDQLGSNSDRPFINSLLTDKNGNVWCGLENGKGLAVYDVKSDRFYFYYNNKSQKFLQNNSVRTLFQTDENTIMLGTKGGISFFDLRSRQYTDPPEYGPLLSGISGYDVRCILEKEPSIYWVGTLLSGLFIYDKARKSLIRHFQDDGYSVIHSNNYMTCKTDKSGNVWFGTFDAGLDVSLKQAKNFNFDVSLNNLTQRKFITSVTADRNKNLIISTRENGFFVYNVENKTHRIYDKSNSKLGHPNIRTIFVDSGNKYWIGIYLGLQIFNPENQTFKSIAVPEPNNGAVSIIQMKDRIFAGTDGQGLLVFDMEGKLLNQFLVYGVNIPMIIKLNEEELLFISYGIGIFAVNINNFDVRKIELADFQKYPGLMFAMNAYMDKDDKVWIGTYNYGLFEFDLKISEVSNYNVKEGLPSSDAIGIEEDDNNNLWMSTSFGLARLNKNTGTIKNYFFNDGVNNYQFHAKAVYKDEEGNFYFGGNLGLTYFNPVEILLENSEAPMVVLENLFVQNHLVAPSETKSILNESLPFTKKITLTYKDLPFSIDFVSFDYLSPEKMQYSYQLEGFDKDWYNVGMQRRAFYSNLPRGNYIFKVKSVNNAGIRSANEAELMIRIKPAPWFSYLAWAIYIAIIAGITYFIFRLQIKTFVYKKNLEIEYSEHLREHEINAMKQKFFSNISHELRTPLTLIYGLVTQLSREEKLSPRIKEYAQSLDINVNRLLNLINQLLTFKKIESETLTLWLEKGNLNDEIRKILDLFSLYAREKKIRIDFMEDNNFIVWFDHDKLGKILSNLLSNAVKHSSKGGIIEVNLKKISCDQARLQYSSNLSTKTVDYIEISVTDTGDGIDEKEWTTIFDRYKQVGSEGKQRPDYSGTGIGLNFTKSLVELHKGDIRMESKPGQGSTFSIVLPYESSVFEPKDFADSVTASYSQVSSYQDSDNEVSDKPSEFSIQTDFEKTVLIIEDDPQLNNFLVKSLKDYYKTISAHDGETGLKMVNKESPDIVVSDIMMPKTDGYELTRRIKGNKELCHIPVILLTAKSETANQIEGMKSGADFYIAKPFNIDFLISAIDSQLKNRKRIHDIFLTGQMPKLDKHEINELDFQFISKLDALLEKELSNPGLDILLLAQNMNMSRSVFYRKFMGLTKLSPVSYIRKHRINKSIELMTLRKYTLLEIGEMTGFGSPSYFSTAFRQEKGISPREYVNQHKDINPHNIN